MQLCENDLLIDQRMEGRMRRKHNVMIWGEKKVFNVECPLSLRSKGGLQG